MTLLTLAAIALAIALLFFSLKRLSAKETRPDAATSRPGQVLTPRPGVPNNKLILLKGADYEDLRRVVKGFCNRYNRTSYEMLPKIFRLPDDQAAIIFPYDTSFEMLCFLVNYLDAPLKTTWNATVTGWATDDRLASDVLIYLSPADTEHDNVWVTTPGNNAFIVSFANTGRRTPAPLADMTYRLPDIDTRLLADTEGEQFH